MAYKKSAFILNDKRNEPSFRWALAWGQGWQDFDLSMSSSGTVRSDGAELTVWTPGRANQGAELHQGLVEVRTLRFTICDLRFAIGDGGFWVFRLRALFGVNGMRGRCEHELLGKVPEFGVDGFFLGIAGDAE